MNKNTKNIISIFNNYIIIVFFSITFMNHTFSWFSMQCLLLKDNVIDSGHPVHIWDIPIVRNDSLARRLSFETI